MSDLHGHKPAPRPLYRTAGPYRWRAGVLWRTWLLGAQYDFQADCWMFHLGPLAVRIWRADR